MNRRDSIKALGATLMAAVLPPWPAFGQAKYPDRPIRLIVPYAPGGVVMSWPVTGHSGRLFAWPLIENQGGAGGTLGASAVARAQPDGYTLLFGDTSSQIITPSLMATPPYDPVNSFAAVSIIATSTPGIVVHPSVPVKTSPNSSSTRRTIATSCPTDRPARARSAILQANCSNRPSRCRALRIFLIAAPARLSRT